MIYQITKSSLGKLWDYIKTFSLSYLGTSACSKSKIKAAKQFKSSFKTKSSKLRNSTCVSSSTSSRNIGPVLFRLVNGEQPLYFIIVILIVLLLLYLFVIKLLHLPFDRGKDSLIIPLL